MFSRFLLDRVQLDQAAVIKQLSGLEVFSGPKIHIQIHNIYIYARRVRVRSNSRRVWILGPEKTSSPDSCLITAAWSNCTRSNKKIYIYYFF